MENPVAPALAIANLKALYCHSADNCAHDPVGGLPVFDTILTSDCVADYGYGPLTGIAAITGFLGTAIAGGSEWMLHMLTSPSITVSGDTASAAWAVQVHSRQRDTGEIAVVVGRYADTFRLTPGGWRISAINFRQLS